jgi:hypothetical protein
MPSTNNMLQELALKKLCVLHTQSVYVFLRTFTINSAYFPTQN